MAKSNSNPNSSTDTECLLDSCYSPSISSISSSGRRLVLSPRSLPTAYHPSYAYNRLKSPYDTDTTEPSHVSDSQENEMQQTDLGRGLGISTPGSEDTWTTSTDTLVRHPSFRTYLADRFHSPSTASLNPFTVPEDPKESENGRATNETEAVYERIHVPRTHPTTITLLALSIFSTLSSGVYLVVAFAGPRYGAIMHASSGLSASTASTLVTLLAKLIELSFITVFTAFVGQLIWRKAYSNKAGSGMTLAQLSVRNWITQPGAILTNGKSVKYGIMSLLGVLSLIAAISALLYTTATNALVSPQLKFGRWYHGVAAGLVQSSYANSVYIQDNCQTPITNDSQFGGSTCIGVEHVSKSYPNFKQFLDTWQSLSGNVSSNQKDRPNGTGALNNITNMIGSWVEVRDMEAASQAAGRIIQNVSYALPHSGVYQAALWAENGVPQPKGLEGLNVYSLQASVPSPVINVLCVNISEEELAPIVYSSWPQAERPLDISTWPTQAPVWSPTEWLNATAVDDIFLWGPKYGQRRPPLFPIYPNPYNTLLNFSGYYAGRDAIYLLSHAGPSQGGDYSLCSLKSSITPFCSTRINATSVGSTMQSHCEDPSDPLQYIKSDPDALSGSATLSLDWVSVAAEWGLSMTLNDGSVGANSSTARILTQLIPTSAAPSAQLPSIAEALAVMAGCTTILSTQNASFVPFWNYTSTILSEPVRQYFNISWRSQQYAAGGSGNIADTSRSWSADGATSNISNVGGTNKNYEKCLYIILIAVFVGNVVALAWLLASLYRKSWIIDFSEPAELFNLAVFSPTPHRLSQGMGKRYQSFDAANTDTAYRSDGGSGSKAVAAGEALPYRRVSELYNDPYGVYASDNKNKLHRRATIKRSGSGTVRRRESSIRSLTLNNEEDFKTHWKLTLRGNQVVLFQSRVPPTPSASLFAFRNHSRSNGNSPRAGIGGGSGGRGGRGRRSLRSISSSMFFPSIFNPQRWKSTRTVYKSGVDSSNPNNVRDGEYAKLI